MAFNQRILDTLDRILNNNKPKAKPLVAGRNARLVCVDGDANHNKYYNMSERSDGKFDVEFGRVGMKPRFATYDMSLWDKKYSEKIAKGYEDVTKLRRVTGNGVTDLFSGNATPFHSILRRLRDFADSVTKDNYSISTLDVTQDMVDAAQDILNNLATKRANVNIDPNDAYQLRQFINEFNAELVKLFKKLPRVMKHVDDYILYADANNFGRNIDSLIKREQDTLDAMAASVKVAIANTNASSGDGSTTDLLKALGLEMREKDSALEDTVKQMLGNHARQYVNCWYVTNPETQARYDADMAAQKGAAHKKEELFWHGSRNENWLSIVTKGLMIRPTGVSTTGGMLGLGIYFANDADKSYGYTSGRNSRWAHGDSQTAFMAIFRVRVGKQLNVRKHTSECYDYTKQYIKDKGNYDSVYAHAGASLRKDEFVIYDPAQCTIYALVELKD